MHHPGFLQAICEDPDDDAHRLIYADWLDEHGDADRAEFIRVQCALAAMDDEDEAMTAREGELLRLHGATWRAELPQLSKVTWGDTFRRGFVESASLPNYLAWRRQRLALLASAPLEMVSITHVQQNTVRRLARSPGIERVRGLGFSKGYCDDDDLEVLGKACRLKAFSYYKQPTIAGSSLTQAAGGLIATSPGFKGLRRLQLGNVVFTDVGASHLASAPNLTDLETLCLRRCDLTAVGVKNLTKQNSWPKLRSLDLSYNHNIADSGARILASSPALSGLRELHLPYCRVGEAGATALARSMFLTNLRVLDLGGDEIGSEGLHALMTSPNLQCLRVLHLSCSSLSGDNIVALLQSPLVTNLQVLSLLGDHPIDAESAAAIVATPGLENLKQLTVNAVGGTDLLRRHFGDRITIL